MRWVPANVKASNDPLPRVASTAFGIVCPA